MAAAKRSVRPICRSIPRNKRAPKSEDKAPPSKSARIVCPAMGGKHSCFGLQSGISKPRGGFTEWIGHESYSIKDLHEGCLFLLKIQARRQRGASPSRRTQSWGAPVH